MGINLASLDAALFQRGEFSHLPLSEKQQEAIAALFDNETEEVGYGGAAGGGKSWLGCYWLILSCLAYPSTKWFIGREELKRITQSTYVTFGKVARSLGLEIDKGYKYNGQLNYIEFTNGSRIDLLDLKYLPRDAEYERFGSTEYTGGWIEEGGEINYGAYEVLSSRIGRHLNDKYNLLGKILITLNPKRNWVYRHFYKPWTKGELSDHRAFIQAFVKDNPYREEGYEKKLDRLTGSKRKRLRDGDWEYDNDETSLCQAEKIEDVFYNEHVVEDRSKRYLTCDIAMRGSDLFVLMVWYGWTVVEIKTVAKSGGKEVLNAILDLRNRHQINPSNIAYDADGVGSFIGGQGGFLPRAKPFNGGAAPVKAGKVKPNYQNLRTQCYYLIAKRINDAGLWVKADLSEDGKDKLRADLSMIKQHLPDSDGKLRILPKKVIIEKLGRSPDYSDALMMREYLDLGASKKLQFA